MYFHENLIEYTRKKIQKVCMCVLSIGILLFWQTAWADECLSSAPPDSPLKGNIVFWATTEELKADTLYDLLTRFSSIYPNVHVLPTFFSSFKTMRDRLEISIISGLGPDVLLLPGKELSVLLDMVELGWVQKLPSSIVDTSSFVHSAIDALTYQNELYGVPFTLNVYALFYNTQFVTTPPTTLSELFDSASEGNVTIINTGFYEAFWGITAFGGSLSDEHGNVAAEQTGFADWLAWLKAAQELPAMILHQDTETLLEYFEQGEAAFYIGSTTDLVRLQHALGKENIGVAPLPQGPSHPARGFLQPQALIVSPAASNNNMKIAAKFIQFLTNTEQQRRLGIHFNHVPANSSVQLDARLAPIVAVFQSQAHIAVPFSPQMQNVLEYGTQLYKQVLEGVLTPDEADNKLNQKLSQEFTP